MKTDMHYYGVYALARAAGMREKPAEIVATASEYVDDAIWDKEVFLEDGRSVIAELTAHRLLDFKNADNEDQRKVWLPFHFLPGGSGKTSTDKLLCQKNSRIAKTMVMQNTEIATEAPYGLYIMGITAHVYADTFAHYGFMGANHSYNAIRAGSIDLQVSDDGILDYIQKKAKHFLKEAVSYGLSQTFPLGHGAATTYPDRPYLRWSYIRETDGKTVERENPKDYVAACKAMHEMFGACLDKAPKLAESGTARRWKDIRNTVKKIIELEGDKQVRIRGWKDAMHDNHLFGGSTKVPRYKGSRWSSSIDDLEPEKIPRDMDKLPVYRFYQAARIHRAHVLSNLLPPNDVIAA
ncbi:MAG: hypothetical protein KGY38_03370 [Desulfobacterales bacterium]|nr:hypothetical protein [Desulfobacterales bacterium]